MKKTVKRIFAGLLVALMLVTAAPLEGFVGIEMPKLFSTKAEAAGLSGYSNYVAAQWAIDHLHDSWSILEGQGYYDNGGDCANFVSQCIYMGGMDMENLWNYAGYYAHYGTPTDGSWIRAHQLYNYVVSQGGISINNPSASQVSVGDLIFWKTTSDGRMHHSAIVIDVENGVPEIAYHSTREPDGSYTNKRNKNWTLGYEGWRIYLVKMNGATCVAQNPRNFDVYIANNDSPFRADASTGATLLKTVHGGDYLHVYQTRSNQGYTWGYGHYKGVWGWTNLGNFRYSAHVTSPPVDHVFGDWFVAAKPTCVIEGVSKRICQRCGYEETKSIAPVGHTPGAAPTCLTPQLCTVCGALLKDALGHDLSETLVMADCYNDAKLHGECKRCDMEPYDYKASTNSWSDWSPVSHKVKNKNDQRTRTAYRWRQRDTKTSYNAGEAGWTQTGGQWIQSGSGAFDFVYEFKGGSAGNNPDWGNGTISSYNRQPYSSYQTTTDKRDVSIYSTGSYLCWHWCQNKHDGDLNHTVESANTGTYNTFHAVTQNYSSMSFTANCYAYEVTNYGCSKWWYKNEIFKCNYTDYRRLFSYEKYSDWSDWDVSAQMPETIQQMIKSGQTTK
ncbi:MAG: amidase domain-containing protein, partial [Ruminococcus sp.]|nr:amidase domain-containing protein [Ruminococcus sp.]